MKRSEGCGRGGSARHCAEGHSKTKVGQEKKGKLRGKALTISHISLWNILPREGGRNIDPSPARCQNTSQKGCRDPSGSSGRIGPDHFWSPFSVVLAFIFVWHLQTQKRKMRSQENAYTQSWLLGSLV